jgi:hypothetical protein
MSANATELLRLSPVGRNLADGLAAGAARCASDRSTADIIGLATAGDSF